MTVLGHAGGLFRGKLPAVRTAVAYPDAARGRTGMTIAMFSLIVLSLVMVATISQNFIALMLGDEANAGWAWGSPHVSSWYKNAFGRVSQNWPFGLIDYWRATLKPDPDDFVLEKAPEAVA